MLPYMCLSFRCLCLFPLYLLWLQFTVWHFAPYCLRTLLKDVTEYIFYFPPSNGFPPPLQNENWTITNQQQEYGIFGALNVFTNSIMATTTDCTKQKRNSYKSVFFLVHLIYIYIYSYIFIYSSNNLLFMHFVFYSFKLNERSQNTLFYTHVQQPVL